MSKGKPFVIYQTLWTGTERKKWIEYDTLEEAQQALERLRNSPSGKHYDYELVQP